MVVFVRLLPCRHNHLLGHYAAVELVRGRAGTTPDDAAVEGSVGVGGDDLGPVRGADFDLNAEFFHVLGDDLADGEPVRRCRADRELELERFAVLEGADAVGSLFVTGVIEHLVGFVHVQLGPVTFVDDALVAPAIVGVAEAGAVGRMGVARHAQAGHLIAVHGHAECFADDGIVKGSLGGVELPVDGATYGGVPEVAVGRILVDKGFLDVGDELVAPIHIAILQGEVGTGVAGEGQHPDAGQLLLFRLPVVGILIELE
ncbi:hypothetical protein SRABI128_04019 [Microbacterium sp. Bi128]|nr:hypothetical protein SRABI128_04019 [Microbacterium sp. Bi128]